MFKISRILFKSSFVANEIFTLFPLIDTLVPNFSFIASSTYLYSLLFGAFLTGDALGNASFAAKFSKSLTLKFSLTILYYILDKYFCKQLFGYL